MAFMKLSKGLQNPFEYDLKGFQKINDVQVFLKVVNSKGVN